MKHYCLDVSRESPDIVWSMMNSTFGRFQNLVWISPEVNNDSIEWDSDKLTLWSEKEERELETCVKMSWMGSGPKRDSINAWEIFSYLSLSSQPPLHELFYPKKQSKY